MINEIGEATMQQFVRTNYNSETFSKDLAIQKTDKVRKHTDFSHQFNRSIRFINS